MVRIIRLGVGVSTRVAKGAAHPFAKALEWKTLSYVPPHDAHCFRLARDAKTFRGAHFTP